MAVFRSLTLNLTCKVNLTFALIWLLRNPLLFCRLSENTKPKVFTDKRFVKTAIFIVFALWTLGAKPLILCQIRKHLSKRALKELSNTLWRGAVALLVPELWAILPKKKMLKYAKCDLCWPLVTGRLTWPKKWQSGLVMLSDALSNTAYREMLRDPGAELEGGYQFSPMSGRGKHRGPAGRRLNNRTDTIFMISGVRLTSWTFLEWSRLFVANLV